MAQIDGGVVSEPLVSGGHIYVLTHDAGLYMLGDGTTPSATPVATPGAVVDLRTPVVCTAAPSDSPMLGNLPATPTIPAGCALEAADSIHIDPIRRSQ